MKKMYFAIVLIGILFTGCATLAGVKSDYKVLNRDEIINLILNKTISHEYKAPKVVSIQTAFKKENPDKKKNVMFTYYGDNNNYFRISTLATSYNRNIRYDFGTWSIKEVKFDKYTYYNLCRRSKVHKMYSDIHGIPICQDITLNGGKLLIGGYLGEPITVNDGYGMIENKLVSLNHVDTDALNDFKKVVGDNARLTVKKQSISATLLKEEQEREKELARQKKARAERAVRLAQQRNQRSNNSGGSSGSTIGLCIPSVPQKCCKSYECRAKTASGSYENATVKLTKDYVGNCYTLDVYSGNGSGGGSTCSGPNDYWAVTANGKSGGANGLSAAISWILHRL